MIQVSWRHPRCVPNPVRHGGLHEALDKYAILAYFVR